MSVVPATKFETDGQPDLPAEVVASQAYSLKPKYDEKELLEQMETQKSAIEDTPIEYYEAKLYDLTCTYVTKLEVTTISMKVLDDIHHIVGLKKREIELTSAELETLNRNIERLLDRRPGILDEYKFFLSMIELIECLSVKWNLFKIDNYGYRLRGRALNITILDIRVMNEHIFSIDTLFVSRILREHPFNKFVDEITHQYAIVLHQELVRLMTYMLQLNNADFEDVPSISGWLAYINPELYTKKFLVPDPYASEPQYQSFAMPQGCLQNIFRSKAEAKALKLRKLVQDFELIYRTFEKSLITLILSISSKLM